MCFIEKTAPDAPEKHQTSINKNKPASGVRFISKTIKPVNDRKRVQCALNCDRLQCDSNNCVLIFFQICKKICNVMTIIRKKICTDKIYV